MLGAGQRPWQAGSQLKERPPGPQVLACSPASAHPGLSVPGRAERRRDRDRDRVDSWTPEPQAWQEEKPHFADCLVGSTLSPRPPLPSEAPKVPRSREPSLLRGSPSRTQPAVPVSASCLHVWPGWG